MKTGLAQDTAKSAKNLAQQIAKQMAQEPLEILKTAGEQITGSETPNQPEIPEDGGDNQKKLLENFCIYIPYFYYLSLWYFPLKELLNHLQLILLIYYHYPPANL